MVGAAFQDCPACLDVLGVGDQERIGARELRPDAIQQVLDRILLLHVGEISARGHLDLLVGDGDDHQRLFGGEADQVRHQLGDISGVFEEQAGNLGITHHGVPSMRWAADV